MSRSVNSRSGSPRITQSAQARNTLEKLRALKSTIPGFQLAPPGRTHLATVASVPDGFLEAATVAVESSAVLKTATGLEPDYVREAVAFAAAYGPVAEEAESLAKSIRHTINIRRSQVGNDALQAYDIAKGLARKPEGAALSSHILEMKRTLGRSGRHRPQAGPTPAATKN